MGSSPKFILKEQVMHFYEHEVPCCNPSCKRLVVVSVCDKPFPICDECKARFKRALRTEFDGQYDLETFMRFLDECGTALSDEKGFWKSIGIDMDHYLDRKAAENYTS